jgi:mono/diheme cytochrome c family protein
MQMKNLLLLVVLLGLISCAENKQPSQSSKIKNIDLDNDAKYQAGRSLYITNCATCHNLRYELAGPALQNVEQRWKDKALLYSFIKNSQAVIAKDAYAKDLYNRYNKVEMTQFAWLKDEEIDQLLHYISVASNKKD